MKNFNHLCSALLLFVCFFAAFAANGQKLKKQVVGNGATSAYADNVAIQGTVGQTIIGYSQNDYTAHGAGFWYDAQVVTGVAEVDKVALEGYHLKQNMPNPCKENTTIQFTIPQHDKVNITLFNQLGQQVHLLVRGEFSAGTYDIELMTDDLIPGTYFYRMESGRFVATKKMMVQR